MGRHKAGRGWSGFAAIVALAALGCQGQPEDVSRILAAASTGPFLESGGLVVMEAENFTGSAPGTGIAAGATWTPRAIPDTSGGVVLEATPNAGVKTDDAIVGPRRDFSVRFTTAGTYQLWVRGRGVTASDDTIHAGLDGTAVTLGGSGLLFPGGWAWVDRVGSRRVTVNVTSSGLHTINLWMREDGVLVDKVLLTTASAFVPTNLGPAESGRETAAPDAGTSPDSGTPDAAPPPQAGAFLESAGQVVMEAESFTGGGPGVGIAVQSEWTARALAGTSGGMVLEATPNAGVKTGESTIGPRRSYAIRFATAGTYQVWVRGRGITADDDTVHLGIDDTTVTLGASGLLFPGGWAWVNTVGSRRVTVTIPAPGVHDIHLWMREDGVLVDKLLLATSPSFVPSSLGPIESAREQVPTPVVVLPPGHHTCDSTCQAQAPAQITVCPGTSPGCTSTRTTSVVWTLEGQVITGLKLLMRGNEIAPRVDSGNAHNLGGGMVEIDGARALVRSDAALALTYYDVAPVWGGTTALPFRLATLTANPTTTQFYWYGGYAIGDTAQQVHQEVVSIVEDEEFAAAIVVGKRGNAFFVPTELASGADGNFSFGDGSVVINYGNPPFWAGSGQTIVQISAQEFSHEYGHEIFNMITPAYSGSSGCLNEGMANAIGYVVGRVPASKMGPFGNQGQNYDGDCKIASEVHDVGNCYFHHARKAGLLNTTFLRSLYHPQHAYVFDSCAPGALRTGDSLVVMFTEATGQDQTSLVAQMGMPTSGSYAASKAQLGF